MAGKSAAAETLLLAGASPNIGHPERGPPLLLAASEGNLAMVDILLDNGARCALPAAV